MTTVNYSDSVIFDEKINKGNLVFGDKQAGFLVYDDEKKSIGLPFRTLDDHELVAFGGGVFRFDQKSMLSGQRAFCCDKGLTSNKSVAYFMIDPENMSIRFFDKPGLLQDPLLISTLVIQDKNSFEQAYVDKLIESTDEVQSMGLM